MAVSIIDRQGRPATGALPRRMHRRTIAMAAQQRSGAGCRPSGAGNLEIPTILTIGPVTSDDPDLPALARIRDGDADGCRLLVDRHLNRMHALATRLLGSPADADEICQDAFVRAWQQAPNWQSGTARFATWLHQVVLNLCRDRLRARRESLPLESAPESVDDDTPERAHGRADSARQIQAALATLPERQREALLLCHFQGLSNIEAAAVLELSVDALESLLARGRRGLRAALASAGEPTLGAGA